MSESSAGAAGAASRSLEAPGRSLDASGRGLAPRITLIDGESGTGKSTLADALVAAWPWSDAPTLVRLDDLYPGWDGLHEASMAVQEDLVLPIACGDPGVWRRWDWQRACVVELVPVSASHPLIVEGCGSLTRASAAAADLRLWTTAAESVRKSRALIRDAGAYDAHWQMWQEQMQRFRAREHPDASADVVIDTDVAPPAVSVRHPRGDMGLEGVGLPAAWLTLLAGLTWTV